MWFQRKWLKANVYLKKNEIDDVNYGATCKHWNNSRVMSSLTRLQTGRIYFEERKIDE